MSEKEWDRQNKTQAWSNKEASRTIMVNIRRSRRIKVLPFLNVIEPSVSMATQYCLPNGWFSFCKGQKKELIGKIRGKLDQRRHTDPSRVTTKHMGG